MIQDILRSIALFAVAVPVAACSQDLRNADLVFVSDTSGSYGSAISGATGNMTHVGIIEVEGDSVYVIDASPEVVRRRTLDDFVKAQASPDGTVPPIVFARVTGCRVRRAADSFVLRARYAVGLPYDWTFMPGNDRYYCSELVCEAMKIDGRPVFAPKPMNFLNPDGSTDPFWTELFSRLGMEIPQGVPGSNSNDLYKSLKVRKLRINGYD